MTLVVIGGTVLDVQARPFETDLQRGSSVPGQVVQVPGGVGRNIAEAAHHLLKQQWRQQQQQQHPPVLLVSVIGQDAAGDALLASFQKHGMCAAGVIRSRTASTPCVVAVLDRSGEVAACVADVAAPAEELTPAVVQQHMPSIQRAGMLILDANLEQPTLTAAVQAAAAAGVPILFEPVSVPKSVRCASILQQLTFITPNANELLAIAAAVSNRIQAAHHSHIGCSGISPSGSDNSAGGSSSSSKAGMVQVDSLPTAPSPQQLLARLAPAAAVVLSQGLRYVVLTMGSQGAALLSLQGLHQPTGLQHRHTDSTSMTSNSGSISSGRQQVTAWHVPAAPTAAAVLNLSGAGDTLTGAFAAALLQHASPQQALAVGVAAAKLAVECKLNVPGPEQGMVFSDVWQQAQKLLVHMQVWQFPLCAAL